MWLNETAANVRTNAKSKCVTVYKTIFTRFFPCVRTDDFEPLAFSKIVWKKGWTVWTPNEGITNEIFQRTNSNIEKYATDFEKPSPCELPCSNTSATHQKFILPSNWWRLFDFGSSVLNQTGLLFGDTFFYAKKQTVEIPYL